MFIYKITNTVNGKCYIGQTRSKRVSDRIGKHKLELNKNIHANQHLQRSWIKYGPHSFTFETIATAKDLIELDLLEIAWIAESKSMDSVFGYNKESGGSLHKTQSKETRQKIVKALIGRPVSEETRNKISESNKIGRKGIFPTSETKAKMSASHKARAKYGSDNHRFGVTTSQRQRQAVRDANARRPKKQVVCITTGQIFSSTREASALLNIDRANITAVCVGLRAATHGLTFRYV